jgi:predicted enzyme related to lactoylglutathione lyase
MRHLRTPLGRSTGKDRKDDVAGGVESDCDGCSAGREDTMELASIRIITDDLEGLATFYELVTRTTAVRPAPVFAEIRAGGTALAIGSTATVAMLGPAAPAPGANPSLIIEFLVEDVDAEFERLRPSLADVVLEPTTMPWGNRSTLFRDPEGNLVNLFSRPAGAAATRR